MYSTRMVATALGVDVKLVGNLMVRCARRLVPAGRQGKDRRIPEAVVDLFAIALLLKRDLHIPVGVSLDAAARLLEGDGEPIPVGRLAGLSFDVARLRQLVRAALAEAAMDRPPRRGRPPGKTKRGA